VATKWTYFFVKLFLRIKYFAFLEKRLFISIINELSHVWKMTSHGTICVFLTCETKIAVKVNPPNKNDN
jgi:hypothetical protein